MNMSEGMGADPPGGLPRRACRLKRRLRHNDDAAAGVVSILLAILVIIILMTLVTTVWMPEWMEGIENDHMKVVSGQFANIKSSVDKQILNGDTKFIIGNPVTLGAKGVSVFGTDSTGTFSINHFRESDLEYFCNVRNESGQVNVTCTGGLKYQSGNVHYLNQQMAYENGALVLKQGDGEVVRVRPQFAIEKHGPVAHLKFVLITVSGLESSVTGTGTIIVQTQLVTYTSAEFDHRAPEWVNITLASEFPTAWSRFFNNTLIEEGFTPGTDYNLTRTGSIIELGIRNVSSFDMGYALINVEIEEETGGSTTAPGLDDVVGLWHMNDGSGTNVMDASKVHNDGTAVNGPAWVGGVQGEALAFDGNDDFVSVPDVAELNVQEGVTVMYWLRWTTAPSSGNAWANPVSKGEHQWEFQHSGDAAGSPWRNAYYEWAVETNDTRTWVWSTSTTTQNVWVHLTGVFDNATHQIRLYVNGTQENATTLNGTINLDGKPFLIGARPRVGFEDRHFEGEIDEVIVFDRALSDSEIARYYQMLKP